MTLIKVLLNSKYSLKCKLKIFKHFFNPEFRGTLRTIDKGFRLIREDDLYFHRLCLNPESFTFSFWKKHPDLKIFDKYSDLKGSILDFGCGTGHLDILLSRQGKIIHGIDISPMAINIANHLRESENSDVRKRVSFSRADVTKEVGPDKYDIIWSNHVFEHIPDPGQVFSGLKNWANLKAYILITVPLGLAYDDPDHVHHFFTEEQMKCHFNKFVEVDKIEVNVDSNEIHLLGRLK